MHYKVSSTCKGEEVICLVAAKTSTCVIRDVLPSTEYKLKVIVCASNNKEKGSNEVLHITPGIYKYAMKPFSHQCG